MSQSLLNRFRGSLFGPIIATRIIEKKTTELNWQIINKKIIINLLNTETIAPETCEAIALQDENISSGELILRILPLILFFHETEYLLSEQIKNIEINQNIINDIMLFRQITNLILNSNNESLKKILTLAPFLEEIQTFLDNHTSLTDLTKKFRQKTAIDNNYLLLSLYCFYRTPDNFKLSILQASQFNHPLILGITATVSGAYNGYSGIPIPWRLTISPEKDYNQLYQQISQLWAKWAGVNDPIKMIKPLETQVINSVKMNNH
ncbi:MAG: ADP-ribosylglycohydrolase family protein [Crocosphaera sp.]